MMLTKPERAHDQCKGFALRRPAVSTFERPDAVGTESGAFGEHFLRETSC